MQRENLFCVNNEWFKSFPRKIFAYYADEHTRQAFQNGRPLKDLAEAFTGLQTGDNQRFIKNWSEVSYNKIKFNCKDHQEADSSGMRWFPYIKGSEFRKWYGNQLCVLNWENDGEEIKRIPSSRPQNAEYYFRSGLAYNNISKNFCTRFVDVGFIFDQKNSMFFSPSKEESIFSLGFLHSKVISPFLDILSPKDFNPGSLKVIPILADETIRQTS